MFYPLGFAIFVVPDPFKLSEVHGNAFVELRSGTGLMPWGHLGCCVLSALLQNSLQDQ